MMQDDCCQEADCCRTDFRYPDPRYPAVACDAVAGRTAAGCPKEWGPTKVPCTDYQDQGLCRQADEQ
jgi:hypothetical protein